MRKVFCMTFTILILTNVTSCLGISRLKDYYGDIVMLCPNPEGGYYGACNLIYTPKTNNYLYINKGNGYRELSFSDDKEKILGLEGNYTIVEYDLKTNNSIIVFKGNEDKEASYDYIKYVPESNYISFNAYPYIYIIGKLKSEKW